MNLVTLIEKIRKEHIHLQHERQSVADELESVVKLMWMVKHQRYVREVAGGATDDDPVALAVRANCVQQLEFLPGYQWLGSNHERNVGEMLQYLRGHPKSLAYMLFFAETKCPVALELLCKIILSTVYNQGCGWRDQRSLIDTMEELMEININFQDDLRRHLHNKNSSFGLLYRHFCDQLPELKTFHKVALTQPLMSVLSEDILFLDIDPDRAVMRFCLQERRKHFGSETSPEYRENLARYQRWTVQKLKYFVERFIRSLRENIYAFPQSLVWLLVRIYGRLIDRFDCPKVNAILVDLIFFFLLCPAIQNPDLFGITDLHINHIASYNLMQCAQIIQLLALSNWEKIKDGPYQVVCDLFEPNCLGFIIDHIFAMSQRATIPPNVAAEPDIYPTHFLISDQELHFLLKYLQTYSAAHQPADESDPWTVVLRKLPSPSVVAQKMDSCDPKRAGCDPRQVLMIRDAGCPQSKVGTKTEQELLAIINKNGKQHLIQEMDRLFSSLEIEGPTPETTNDQEEDCLNNNDKLHSATNPYGALERFGLPTTSQVVESGEDDNEPKFHSLPLLTPPDDEECESAEMSMQSLGTLTLNLTDLPDELPPQQALFPSFVAEVKTNVGHKVLTGIKSIKNRVKNISLKEPTQASTNKTPTTARQGSLDELSGSVADLETVKAETDEIFGKYRGSVPAAKPGVIDTKPQEELTAAAAASLPVVPSMRDIKNQLRKLMCTMDMSSVYRRYRFLDLNQKCDLIMFLKILMSQSSETATTVLIMDLLRNIQTLTPEELAGAFEQIEVEWRTRKLYVVYLFHSRRDLLQRLQQLQSLRAALEEEGRCADFVAMSFVARALLERHDPDIQRLIGRFQDASTPPDEKAALVKSVLANTVGAIRDNEAALSETQRALLRQIQERHLMNRIYLYAFYPNGDIDSLRDQILHKQIGQLAATIGSGSNLLNIAPQHQATSPWPSAQTELLLMVAHKTPRDKLQCIIRCCNHIMALLGQAAATSTVASADDLLPVLIFVVIKANPRAILSTIQYINTFYLNDMTGEEAYYWTQFCSAVEFIKTILNEQV